MPEQETDNPDLRDRAYVYWRLLSSDPEAARSVVLAEKPVISQGGSTMDPQLLQTLVGNLSTLSSVYHLPPTVGQPSSSPECERVVPAMFWKFVYIGCIVRAGAGIIFWRVRRLLVPHSFLSWVKMILCNGILNVNWQLLLMHSTLTGSCCLCTAAEP